MMEKFKKTYFTIKKSILWIKIHQKLISRLKINPWHNQPTKNCTFTKQTAQNFPDFNHIIKEKEKLPKKMKEKKNINKLIKMLYRWGVKYDIKWWFVDAENSRTFIHIKAISVDRKIWYKIFIAFVSSCKHEFFI